MPSTMKYILVTGTNGGLGLGICCRLIDEFLSTYPRTASLTLLFTTRSSRKSADTLKTLREHLAAHKSPDAHDRIHFQPESVELTNLLSIRTLAAKLNASSIPKLDAIILNAGIAGWSGLNWPMAVGTILYDIRTNTTWPRFKLGIAGLLAPNQFPENTTQETEPPLGQIFCANVFGHYMLAHWLMPLLQACASDSPAKIMWISSIETQKRHFSEDDLQGLRSNAAYEHSKRLTDVLALTYEHPALSSTITNFQSSSSSSSNRKPQSTPTMHVSHPGVCPTSIISLYWIVHQFYVLGILLARLAGSPWATLSTYTAATVMSWLALAPQPEIKTKEATFGRERGWRVKWGTAVSRLGASSVRPTEVEGWGLNGSGDVYAERWWAGKVGRVPGAKEATREDTEEFVAQGRRVWQEMEKLREEWEQRIEKYEQTQKS